MKYKFKQVTITDHTSILEEADKSGDFVHSRSEPNFKIKDFLLSFEHDPEFLFFITKSSKGRNVGFISVLPHKQKHTASIGPMYLAKKYREQGIGKKQVQLVIDWAKDNNVSELVTRTWSSNRASEKIFAQLGFEIIKEIPNDRINGDSTLFYSLKVKT